MKEEKQESFGNSISKNSKGTLFSISSSIFIIPL